MKEPGNSALAFMLAFSMSESDFSHIKSMAANQYIYCILAYAIPKSLFKGEITEA